MVCQVLMEYQENPEKKVLDTLAVQDAQDQLAKKASLVNKEKWVLLVPMVYVVLQVHRENQGERDVEDDQDSMVFKEKRENLAVLLLVLLVRTALLVNLVKEVQLVHKDLKEKLDTQEMIELVKRVNQVILEEMVLTANPVNAENLVRQD